MLNSCAIMGRIVADPVLRTTPNGTQVSSFTVAVERDRSVEKTTDFFDCVAWRGTAEFICNHFKKGNMIALLGSMQMRKWEDKNGNNRVSWELAVQECYFTGERLTGTVTTGTNIKPDDSEFDVQGELPFD